jgi:RNA ligase
MENLIKTLERYVDEGRINRQRHPSLPISIWSYSIQTHYARDWDEITTMARGLVTLDETGEILARPWAKFFNLEESHLYTPTDKFEVYEKVDGSLIIAFYLWGEWVIASSGSFISDHAQVAKRLFDEFDTSSLDIETTYLFELTAPFSRVVVDYGTDEKLTLLGAIHTETGIEFTYPSLQTVAQKLGCSIVQKFEGITDYTSLKGMVGNNEEGYVVRFSNGERIKIKGEEYVRLHTLLSYLSTTSVWETVSNGDDIAKVLNGVPDEIWDRVRNYEAQLKGEFINIDESARTEFEYILQKVGYDNRKLFAENVNGTVDEYSIKSKYAPILFRMYENRPYSEIIWNMIKPEYRRL